MASQYDLPYTGPQVEALLAKISELESEMPSKTSDLTNDSGFITSEDVPTKTSDLNNDSGFITNAPVAAEAARAQAAEALLATIASLQAEITRATGVEGTLQDLIDGIAAKIPSAATDQNQLADKAFVNSSIATATAEFRGTYNSLAELQAVSADQNDYGYVRTTDEAGNTVFKRYKYASGSWVFEYDLNNSSFTSSQWAAINSAITAELVAKLSALPDNATLTTALAAKQDVIDDLSSIRSKANSAYQKPSGGIPASDIADGVIPDVSGKVNTSDIADNLTTNDATKVLSAKQGKVLNENLTQLRSEVNEFVTGSQVPSVNLFDKTAISAGKNINRNTGVEATNADYDATDFIPIDSRGLYCNNAYAGGASIGAAIYDSAKQYKRGTISKGITYEEGDAYVRYSIKVANVDTAMCVAGTIDDLPGEYVPFGPVGLYELKDGIVGTDTIKDEAVTFDKIGFRGVEIGKNKLNPAEVVSDVYINRDNGNEVDYSGAANPTSATGFIPVSKKGLHFNVGITFGTFCGAAVYNASKQYIRSCGMADYYYAEGDAFVRWSFRTSNLSVAQVEEGNTGTEYEAYTERDVIDPVYLPSSEEEEIELKVFLPDTIYAVVGDTLQIFYQSVVRSVDVSQYDVRVSCSKGRQFHRYFEYTPESGDIGTTTFRITVLDDFGTIIGSASCNLVTVAVGASPSAGKKIVCVGASTTANGKWPAETFRRLTGSGGTPSGDGKSNIVFCGNKTKDGTRFVGYSGWSWLDYATQGRPAFRFTIGTTPNVAVGNVYTNNGFSYTIIEISDDGTILCSTSSASNVPQESGTLVKTSGSGDANVAFSASALDSQNPFWDYTNNKLTFVPFANSYCGGTIDAMYVWLGGNGLVNWNNDFSDYRGYMVDFADTLHTEYPSAKIYLICGSLPSMKVMMPGYGASGTGWADTFGMIDSFFNLRKFYQEFANDASYSGFVEFVDATSEFDGDYNFPLTQKAVNTRNNSVTEPYANNTIHPGDAGYMQIADSVYRHFVAKFCQS